jgi:Rha family phage regulatory protein
MKLAIPADVVQLKGGHAVTTSLDVAKIFARRHKDIIRAIRQLNCSEEFGRRNFMPDIYLDEQGRPQPCYEIKKDGWFMLVMSFTGRRAAQFKEAYIAAFNKALDDLAEIRGESLPALRQQNLDLSLENHRLKAAVFRTDKSMRQVRRYLEMGLNYTEVARLMTCSRGRISRIARLLQEVRLIELDDIPLLAAPIEDRQRSLL